MNELFKLLMSNNFKDEELLKYLNNCTVKVIHNGKPIIDIENGIDNLAKKEPEYPKKVSERVQKVDDTTYHVYRVNDPRESYSRVHFSAGENNPGITVTDLLNVLGDYCNDNKETLRGIEYARQRWSD